MGVPYEFSKPEAIRSVDFRGYGSHHQPPGTWSDDGSLMLAQLDSLLVAGFDPADFGRRAVAWFRRHLYTPDGDGRFDIGTTTRVALEALESGAAPTSAGPADEGSCGNGSLMRILPLALVERDLPDEVLVDHAHQLSRVTHGNPRTQVACALYLLVARRLLGGSPRADALGWGRTRLHEIYRSEGRAESLLAALDHLEAWPERAGRGRVWDSFWSAWDAFASAADYGETIERAIRYGNDTDTTAAIAGGLAGIRFGVGGIPGDWLAHMRGRDIVSPLVDGLVATAGRRTSTASPLRVDWFDAYIPLVQHAGGRLGMTMLPGKKSAGFAGNHWRDVEADVVRLKSVHGCNAMVVLVEDPELESLGAGSLPQALKSHGIDLIRFSIPDGNAPRNRELFRKMLDGVIRRLLAGQVVVVACRGGLGRTGLAVACLVRDLGDYPADEAILMTQMARKGAVETHEQVGFVGAWSWPRRRPVAMALTARRRQLKLEDSMAANDPEKTFERLLLGLRSLLRNELVERAYLDQPESGRPARFVCLLVEPRDPVGLAQRVRRQARRFVAAEDFAVVFGAFSEAPSVTYRIVPAPSKRLGE